MRGKSIYTKLRALLSNFRVHFLLLGVMIIATLVLIDTSFKELDVQRTEFLLSVLIQSQAAMLAIVVFITLISIYNLIEIILFYPYSI